MNDVSLGAVARVLIVGLLAASCSPSAPPPTGGDVAGQPTAAGASTPAGPASPQVALATPAPSPSPLAMVQLTSCTFVLGFADLRQKIGPETVGECLEDESVLESGDTSQPTTKGELVFRKADGRMAFTNGTDTWIEGPNGVEKRPNGERFAWEPDGNRTARAAATPFAIPPSAPGAILPSRRIVSYYGNHLSEAMGILGEIPPPQMIARLKEQAAAYAAADPTTPVQPALEFIAVVAQEGPGREGFYRLRMDTEIVEEVAQWAEANNFLLILDIQPGRNSIAPEIQWMMPFLKRPYVHVALDPEFVMAPDQLPGEHIGSLDAATINQTIQTLSELVRAENIPPKLLIIHRFTERMVRNYRDIRPDPHVQVAIIMDGFGSPEAKISKYDLLVRDQRVQYTGFKLFYKQDKPVLTPKQVLELDPSPMVVIYQ